MRRWSRRIYKLGGKRSWKLWSCLRVQSARGATSSSASLSSAPILSPAAGWLLRKVWRGPINLPHSKTFYGFSGRRPKSTVRLWCLLVGPPTALPCFLTETRRCLLQLTSMNWSLSRRPTNSHPYKSTAATYKWTKCWVSSARSRRYWWPCDRSAAASTYRASTSCQSCYASSCQICSGSQPYWTVSMDPWLLKYSSSTKMWLNTCSMSTATACSTWSSWSKRLQNSMKVGTWTKMKVRKSTRQCYTTHSLTSLTLSSNLTLARWVLRTSWFAFKVNSWMCRRWSWPLLTRCSKSFSACRQKQ